MVRLFLHVGMPKTGTSFLQIFFRDNNKVLNKQNFVYPDFKVRFEGIGTARNGHFLIHKEENAEEVYNASIEQLKELSQKYNNIILSEEGLWNNSVNISKFVKDMEKQDIKVKIVVYLRRQDLYLQSKWAQNVKENMKIGFYKYVQKQKEVLDYYEQLCALSELVGKENIIVRVYEKQQFIGEKRDLLSDFFETVGLSWNEEFEEIYEKNKETKKNVSLTGIYLSTKQKLNSYPEFATKLNFVVPYLYAVAEKRNDKLASFSENRYFTYEQQMEFLANYAESNEKIAKEFLGRKDGVLFMDEIIDNHEQKVSYTGRDYIDVLAEVILLQQQEITELKKQYKEAIEAEKANSKKLAEEKEFWKKTAEESVTAKVSKKLKNIMKK